MKRNLTCPECGGNKTTQLVVIPKGAEALPDLWSYKDEECWYCFGSGMQSDEDSYVPFWKEEK